jgi:hypothetical protein
LDIGAVIHVVQQPTHEAKWAHVPSYWNAAKSEGIPEVLVAHDSRMGEGISGYHESHTMAVGFGEVSAA